MEEDGEYFELRAAAHYLLFQRFRGYPWITKALGGIEISRVHKGNDMDMSPFRPLSAVEQREALDIIHKELDTTMALCGERLLSNLGHHNLLNTGV